MSLLDNRPWSVSRVVRAFSLVGALVLATVGVEAFGQTGETDPLGNPSNYLLLRTDNLFLGGQPARSLTPGFFGKWSANTSVNFHSQQSFASQFTTTSIPPRGIGVADLTVDISTLGASGPSLTAAELAQKYPDKKYVQLDGVSLHYEQEGLGRPLIFLHGTPTDYLLWRTITPALTYGNTIYTLDLMGFGLSEKPANQAYSLDTYYATAGVLRGAPSPRRVTAQERCDGEKICGGVRHPPQSGWLDE